MTKLRLLVSIPAFLLLASQLTAQNSYRLFIRCVDKDSAFIANEGVPAAFINRISCTEYINQLPGILRSKGFVTVSLDSVRYDSTYANVVLYAGDIYKWAKIDASQVDGTLL